MKKHFLYLILILFLASACSLWQQPDEPSDVQRLNEYIYQVLKTEKWYLWEDKIPNLDPDSYEDSYAFLEDLKYSELDKWSYLTTEEEYQNFFNSGTYYGYGFGYKITEQNKMFVSYVFDNSPMANAGIKRGSEILSVNGITIAQMINQNLSSTQIFGPNELDYTSQMNVVTHDKDTVEISVGKEEVVQNTVLYKNVYDVGGIKTGYLVFKTFIHPSVDELTEAFAYFQTQNVRQLILDLRYNGGGLLSVSQYLASLIGGEQTNGKKYITLKNNVSHSDNDTVYYFDLPQHALTVSKVVFITTKGTASASEAVINGLKPYVENVSIGDDTHGKPVGMYSFSFEGYRLIPICFRLENSLGYGGYFDGLAADAYRIDDIQHDWGDTSEVCFNEALFYLKNGRFSDNTVSKTAFQRKEYLPLKGFAREIGGI